MAVTVSRRRIKDRLVRDAGPDGLSHPVVAVKDQALGAELAEILRLLLAPLERIEGVHDVLNLIAFEAIEVKVRGVEFCADDGPPLLVPPERWPVVPKILRERLDVPCSEGQL